MVEWIEALISSERVPGSTPVGLGLVLQDSDVLSFLSLKEEQWSTHFAVSCRDRDALAMRRGSTDRLAATVFVFFCESRAAVHKRLETAPVDGVYDHRGDVSEASARGGRTSFTSTRMDLTPSQ
ncbi:unnamed protein product [Caenorhabditis auriculariae]|uniref:Uncharacterized protein n=1 Tax=Caenorhabditis auriculariae TaxID=2777116 RepID=A0A8S1HWP4_9PELO|nr:unnamed protein product [Caenorhabditis auriculariae]